MSKQPYADAGTPSKLSALQRAQWVTPRVIVSDLGDARAQTIIPGGDGSTPSYGPYGS
jgi:hypothetical protein